MPAAAAASSDCWRGRTSTRLFWRRGHPQRVRSSSVHRWPRPGISTSIPARGAAWVEGFARVDSVRRLSRGGRDPRLGLQPRGPGHGHRAGARPRAADPAPDRVHRPAVERRADDTVRDRGRRDAGDARARLHGRAEAGRSRGSRTCSSPGARSSVAAALAGRPPACGGGARPGLPARLSRPVSSLRRALTPATGGFIQECSSSRPPSSAPARWAVRSPRRSPSSDIPVVLKDIDQKFVDHGLEKAREVTKGQLDRLVSKEKLTQEQADARLEEVMGLIEGTTSYDSFGDVDFVIEAAPEKMEIKQSVYAELDAVTPGHAILASNTSSLSISEMGDATLRPEKVVGFHFFYPASVMPLVEIIEGEDTDPEVVQAAYNFAQAIKKQPITCQRGSRLRRQPHPQLGRRRDLARPGGAGALDQEDRRSRRRRQRRADGPVLPRRPARPRHRPARRRAPPGVLRRLVLRPQGHAEARRRRQARRQDWRLRASTKTASRRSRATVSPTARRSPS